MPFGVRRVSDREEPHDFDEVYRNLLRPIAVEEGWDVVRVDELVETGVVTTQAVSQLISAELVLADVSMPNGNVYYELGIRQAVSNSGTLLVALAGTQLPFDIANQRVLFYGPDLGGPDFREAYRQALRISDPATLVASPVRSALEAMGLTAVGPKQDPAGFQREFDLRVSRARTAEQLVAAWHWAKPFSPLPVSALMNLAERLADAQDYENALEVLSASEALGSADYEVHRQRGFYLRNLGKFSDAETEFHRALSLNASDPETLGMLGGSYKRAGRFPEALTCYERGVSLSPTNVYMRVNQAGMAILSSPERPEKGLDLYEGLRQFIAQRPGLMGDSWAALVLAEVEYVAGEPRASDETQTKWTKPSAVLRVLHGGRLSPYAAILRACRISPTPPGCPRLTGRRSRRGWQPVVFRCRCRRN